MPKGTDFNGLSDQLEMVFKACDKDSKGFLTENCLSSALDQILPQKEKMEILEILGVLNVSDAQVSLTVFKKKVLEFLENASEMEEDRHLHNDKENVSNYEAFLTTHSQAEPQAIPRRNTFSSLDDSINLKMSPFKPNLNSSFLICESAGCSPPGSPSEPLSRLSFLEDTFEGDGEDNPLDTSDFVDTCARRNSILQNRSLKFRKHLRSHRYNQSKPSPTFLNRRTKSEDKPDRLNNNSPHLFQESANVQRSQNEDQLSDCLTWERKLLNLKLQEEEEEKMKLQEENILLQKQLSTSEMQMRRVEAELSTEVRLVQGLEEKLLLQESQNKELAHDLENSKYNIRNLEEHLLFIEEKINNENKELIAQKYMLMQDREHFNKEKLESLEKEKKFSEKMEELETRENEITSEKHIQQSEIATLKRENETLQEKLQSLKISSQEEIRELLLENKALKEKLNNQVLKQVDICFVKNLVCDNESEPILSEESQKELHLKNSLRKFVRRIFFHTALRSVYEILMYLLTDYYT